jgi:hypothetical protein
MQSDPAKEYLMDAYKLACTPMAFVSPHYQNTSAWHEHLPLAFWLVENLRPATVVELGTHYGVSYFAFCQAVKQLGLDARCYAVDTWLGDEHAGRYDENVYATVVAHNNEHYSASSRLIRSSFDKARQGFRDGEIDLLHIDGHHSYESVKHDFENWLPKMSDKSVVLLHDTNVREKGFGVFRLLEELRSQYPYFEFIHGHGLAIIGTGGKCGQQLKSLFEFQKIPDIRVALLNIFARFGRTCADAVKLKEQSAEIVKFKQSAADEDVRFGAQIAQLSSESERSGSELEALRREINEARNETESLTQQLNSERNKLASFVQQCDSDQVKLGELEVKIKELESSRNDLQREAKELQGRFSAQISLLEQQAHEYTTELSIRFEEIAILTKIVGRLEKLQPENESLRQTAIDEIRKVISAFATTGPQRSIFGKRRLTHYSRVLEQTGVFDADWYLQKYEDVEKAGMNPSRHYLEYGLREGRLPNPRLEK